LMATVMFRFYCYWLRYLIYSYVTLKPRTMHPTNGLRLAGAVTGNTTGVVVIPITNSNSQSDVSRTFHIMQIAVDYYIDLDLKKASYFQKKLNSLVVKSLSAPSVERIVPVRENLSKKIKH
jgi:hypothetical protein